MIDLQIPLPYRKDDVEFILKNYKNATMTVENMAKKFNVTTRTIQRLVKKHGLSRTVAEANKVTAKLKDYSSLKVPEHLKAKRIILKQSVRYAIIAAHPYCSTCGRRPSAEDNVALEVDHIDNNAQNNDKSNLQVLCRECNRGKR